MRRTATYWVLVAGLISALLQIVPTPVAVVLAFANLLFPINLVHICVLLAAILVDSLAGRLPKPCLVVPPLVLFSYAAAYAFAVGQSQSGLTRVAEILAERNVDPPFPFDPRQHALVMQPTYQQAILAQFQLPEIFVRSLRNGLLRQTVRPLSECQLPPPAAPYDVLADNIDSNNPLLKRFCFHREEVAFTKQSVEVNRIENPEQIGGVTALMRTYAVTVEGRQVATYTDAQISGLVSNPLLFIGCVPSDDEIGMWCGVQWMPDNDKYVPEMLWESEVAAHLLGLAPRTASEIEALTTR